jgi:hypothetical protein
MDSLNLTNLQDEQANKTKKIMVSRVNETTSPEEKRNNAMHYTITCAMKEVLGFNLDNNLRDFYGSEDSSKNKTTVHKEIKASFEENPSRFIQRNSGFTVVCNGIAVPQKNEFGVKHITLTNPSLINGAQTQGMLKEISKEYGGELDNTNVRVEIIVEKNLEEVKDIAIARNTSTNVSVLSRMGANDNFKILQKNMLEVLGVPAGKIQIKETDDAIPTQTLLQVIKAMTPETLENSHKGLLKPSAVISYSSKAGVLTEFRKMMENKKKYEDVLNYFHTFSGLAWKEFESWTSDNEWVKYIKKYPKIGKYNEETNEVLMQWGLICPAIYGLKSFLVEDTGKWTIKYPKHFNRKTYIELVINMFKDSDKGKMDLQTFAKDRGTYLELLNYTLKTNYLNN